MHLLVCDTEWILKMQGATIKIIPEAVHNTLAIANFSTTLAYGFNNKQHSEEKLRNEIYNLCPSHSLRGHITVQSASYNLRETGNTNKMWLGNVWDRGKNIGSLYVFHRLCESKLNLGYDPRKGFRLMLQDDETTVRRNFCNHYSNYKTSHHRKHNMHQHGYENLTRRSWIFG